MFAQLHGLAIDGPSSSLIYSLNQCRYRYVLDLLRSEVCWI